MRYRCGLFLSILFLAPLSAQNFVNWETPHVHPLELTPDGTKLLAVNLPDGRLEVFDTTFAGGLRLIHSIPVGVDPVTVRARSNGEAWVVNHISDSVSIVDLDAGTVIATLQTDDEPCDVVFAGKSARAFVSCSQVNRVLVFDPADLTAAPERITILGEDPRALAVSADGSQIYAAIFESGNNTTIIDNDTVDLADGPYHGTNPPPNDGTGFSPAKAAANGVAPKVTQIVRCNERGQWLDDNDHDWTEFVSGDRAADSGRVKGWHLLDHDLAIIDAETFDVTYADHSMTTCMSLAVQPGSGAVAVIGTESLNQIRFAPNLKGVFLRVFLAIVDPASPASAPEIIDLNPHLDYAAASVAESTRLKSIGDPRAIVWDSEGETAYVAGMGSNNIVAVTETGARVFGTKTETIDIGEGPTGLALAEKAGRLYALNKFEASISVIDLDSEAEIERVQFFDPTPAPVRAGRKHNYNTHETSGLGHVACASCHLDSRTDRLAWDLGNPAGEKKSFDENCIGLGLDSPFQPCSDWHPMKGPLVTMTLQDIIGKEPFHWRGDRESIEEFNITFMELQGRESGLTDDEMSEYRDFLASIYFPPNPFRNFDNTLPDQIDLAGFFTTGDFGPAGKPLPDGDANAGFEKFDSTTCTDCHYLPTGLGIDGVIVDDDPPTFDVISPGEHGERHHMLFLGPIKIASLRGLYDKVGFDRTQEANLAGFGFRRNGNVDSLPREAALGVNVDSDQTVADITAFLLAFSGSELQVDSHEGATVTPSQDTHAAVGKQWTLDGVHDGDAASLARLAGMKAVTDSGAVGLIAKGLIESEPRGYAYLGDDVFQSDREDELLEWNELLGLAGAGEEVTLTVVPKGAEIRLGVDRDSDGAYDADEIVLCSDPADATSLPGAGCDGEFRRGDCSGDGNINIADPILLLNALFLSGPPLVCRDACDIADNGALSLSDAIQLLSYLFQSGAEPAEPAAACGVDPTPDNLDCAGTAECKD